MKYIDFYHANFDRIKKDYNSFYSNGLNQLLPIHCIHYFLNFVNYFKKVIIWPANQVYLENNISNEIGCDFFNLNRLIENKKQLYFVKKSFYDIKLDQSDDDKRINNHLSLKNHNLVYNLIFEWFFNDRKILYGN